MKYFESALLKYFNSHKNDLNHFIIEDWKRTNYSLSNYMQDVFLFKTGIIGVNTLPSLTYKNKYFPSITFISENRYNELSGNKSLSEVPLSLKLAEIRISDHLIKYYLPCLKLSEVKELLQN